jgi:hypothetical protein
VLPDAGVVVAAGVVEVVATGVETELAVVGVATGVVVVAAVVVVAGVNSHS